MSKRKSDSGILDDSVSEILQDIINDPEIKTQIEAMTHSTAPTIGQPGWTEWVLSQLKPNEIIDGAPKVDGLRRIAQEIVGLIIHNEVIIVQAPSHENRYNATALCKIIINSNEHRVALTYQDVSDANTRNTPHPFNLHLSATAASRAEGRALRKILQLTNIIAAEEKAPDNAEAAEIAEQSQWEPEFITGLQMTLLDKLCSENDVNVFKYLNSGRKKYNSVAEVSRDTAANAIEFLYKYAKEPEKIPKPVKGYIKDWDKETI